MKGMLKTAPAVESFLRSLEIMRPHLNHKGLLQF